MASASATAAAEVCATANTEVRLPASDEATAANPASTAAAATAGRTWKLSVSSHNMGARINAEVHA